MLVDRNNKDEDRSIESVCIIPTVKSLSENQSYRAYLNSHEWIVDKVEAYGTNGILKRVHCNNCGIEGMTILSDLAESVARSKAYRRKLAEGKALTLIRNA